MGQAMRALPNVSSKACVHASVKGVPMHTLLFSVNAFMSAMRDMLGVDKGQATRDMLC